MSKKEICSICKGNGVMWEACEKCGAHVCIDCAEPFTSDSKGRTLCIKCKKQAVKNKDIVSLTKMIDWLKNQVTDISKYDPVPDMEDGEHVFGTCMRRDSKVEQNKIVKAIIKRLKYPNK